MTYDIKNLWQIIKVFCYRMRKHPPAAVVLIIILLAGIFCISRIYDKLAVDGRHQAIAMTSQQFAQQQAFRLKQYIKKEQAKLSAFANRPWVSKTLTSDNLDQLQSLEALLSHLSPGNVKSLVVLPQDNRLTKSQDYAASDLLLRTETTLKAPQPEFVKSNGQWVIIFIQPVLSNNKLYIGALLNILTLQQLMDQLNKSRLPGRTELLQKIPKFPEQTILSTGMRADLAISEKAATHNNHWSIVFKANQAINKQIDLNILDVHKITGSVAILFLLILGLTIRFFWNLYKIEPLPAQKPEQDQEFIEWMVEDEPAPSQPKEPDEEKAADKKDSFLEIEEAVLTTIPEQGLYPETVFRQYDIRGIYGEQITDNFALQLGRALGTMALSCAESVLITAYDGRTSSPELYKNMEEGILSTGCDVLHIGAVPTPVFNFACHTRKETSSGVIITASHNPADYNGFKICLNNQSASVEDIQQIYQLMLENNFHHGEGELRSDNIEEDYLTRIREDIAPAFGLKVVVDAGNGIAGRIAPRAIEELGCQVIPLFCEVDGTFPNRAADTSKAENLAPLVEAVKQHKADIGLAFDGDGDRLVAVDSEGKIVWPDELLMIFAKDILSRSPGADIVFDVKSTHRLNDLISSYSGRPVMWKTGHANIRRKVAECNAPLGGEYSGHIFFSDRWFGFDDAIYAAVRLIEIITSREQSLAEIINLFPRSVATAEITIDIPDDEKFTVMDKIIEQSQFNGATLLTLDGLRADYPKAWGLVRASNTSPSLTLRFEAETEEHLTQIKSLFQQQLRSIDPRLNFT